MDLNEELISLYADGELSTEDAAAVEGALESNPALREALEEMRLLDRLFGAGEAEAEAVSDGLRERLHELKPVQTLSGFEPVAGAERQRPSGLGAAAAAAAVVVAVVVLQLRGGAEVVLQHYTRLAVQGTGVAGGATVKEIESSPQLKLRAGDRVTAGPAERVQFRLPNGSEIILLPGATVQLDDPAERVLGELERGAMLVTVHQEGALLSLGAGGYAVYANRATFGVRVRNGTSTAGPAVAREVSIAVGRGTLEVDLGGDRKSVSHGQRVVLRRGRQPEWSPAWKDDLFLPLLRAFERLGREIIPGYFDTEAGVTVIPNRRWTGEARRRELTLSDESAGAARHLVLHVRAARPTPLLLTRVKPTAENLAETSTVETDVVGTDWCVISVPVAAFDGPEARKGKRRLLRNRSRWVRLDLMAVDAGVEFELKASLWAARPPLTGEPEDVR
ncbi:MAG: zf-HC2 domain-containing protein [Planctomycetota bacterium]